MCGRWSGWEGGGPAGGPCCPGRGRPEGFVQPCLLLLLKQKPAHGYELLDSLGEFGFEEGWQDPATVYRNLRRLEHHGLVRSEWEPGEGGPARRVYSLTPEGEEMLHAWAVTIRRTAAGLERFLQHYQALFPQGGTP